MNIRQGSQRLSAVLLGIIWVVWLVAASNSLAKLGESIPYLLAFTGCYLAFCKAVAWVYNGFAGK